MILTTSAAIWLLFTSNPSTKFHLAPFGGTEAVASGLAGVGMAVNQRSEIELLDWILVGSRKCDNI